MIISINKPSSHINNHGARNSSILREADLETREIMLKVANRQEEGWLRTEDAEKFACKELRSIDQLWLKYSGGKFGISVQQQIYQSLGRTK